METELPDSESPALEQTSKLVFIYNADSGLFNTMTDIAHKIFSPASYNCQLCALTHSYFSAKVEWKQFISGIDIPLEFLHKDEYLKKYPAQLKDFPAIVLEQANQQTVMIDASALNQCNSLEELKTLITEICQAVQADDVAIE